jgi:two-component system sensor histidine kinase/response regulator
MRLLIIDDERINRELLRAYLEESYELIEADSAESGLAAARDQPPDLVLLDVMLPGMSGFDAVTLLKDQAGSDFLPVILVTALNDQAARVRGLRAGADEFVSKPVDRNELIVRISNLLALRKKDAALLQRNVELLELHKFREEVTSMIVHDLRNPLSAVQANLQFLLAYPDADGQEASEALTDSLTASSRALRMIENLLDVTRMETGRLQLQRTNADVSDLVGAIIGARARVAKSRAITIDTSLPEGLTINADVDLITRVLENVFDNAMRYTPSGGRIAVCGTVTPDSVTLLVGNTGAAIPVAARTHIFEKFGRTDESVGRMNLGLGLYFCRLAAEAHGGRIRVENNPAFPTVFSIQLPA